TTRMAVFSSAWMSMGGWSGMGSSAVLAPLPGGDVLLPLRDLRVPLVCVVRLRQPHAALLRHLDGPAAREAADPGGPVHLPQRHHAERATVETMDLELALVHVT